jgi:hypothetical protein
LGNDQNEGATFREETLTKRTGINSPEAEGNELESDAHGIDKYDDSTQYFLFGFIWTTRQTPEILPSNINSSQKILRELRRDDVVTA